MQQNPIPGIKLASFVKSMRCEGAQYISLVIKFMECL